MGAHALMTIHKSSQFPAVPDIQKLQKFTGDNFEPLQEILLFLASLKSSLNKPVRDLLIQF